MDALWWRSGNVPVQRGRTGRRAAALQELRAYWEGLRADAGGGIPFRRQVDPRGIERQLEYAFILERVAPGVARLRLAGMHLADLMGMEVRGMPLSALFAPAARDDLAARLEQVFVGPAIVEIELSGERGIGRPSLAASMLLMPLRSETGEVSRALGCLVAEGTIGRAPRRFVPVATVEGLLDPQRGTPTPPRMPAPPIAPPRPAPGEQLPAAARTATPAADPPRAATRAADPGAGTAPGMAETAAPYSHARPARRPDGRPALRLVKSDR